MKQLYVLISFLLSSALILNAQIDNDDDVYNVGKPVKKNKYNENDSTQADSTSYYSDNNYYYRRHFWFHPRFYVNCYPNTYYYNPHYHWWCHHHPHEYYSGTYWGHRGDKNYYGHRKEVASTHPRMGIPRSKPFSSRGGFGSTGKSSSSGGFSGHHSSGGFSAGS